MDYCRTQHGPWYLLLAALGVVTMVVNELVGDPVVFNTMLAVMAVVGLVILSFSSLTVSDDGDALLVVFGPIPLWRKRIPYDEMTEVERSRTSLLTGWGIHYSPFSGLTWNVWGFDCVRIHRGDRVFQVGTDDPDGLLRFLQQRLQQRNSAKA